MDFRTATTAPAERGDSSDNSSQYFGRPLQYTTGAAVGSSYAIGDDILPGGSFPPDHEPASEAGFADFACVKSAGHEEASTAPMLPTPLAFSNWQGSPQFYENALYSPTTSLTTTTTQGEQTRQRYHLDYFGPWASGAAQPLVGMASPQCLEQQQSVALHQPDIWGQTLTPPDEGYHRQLGPGQHNVPVIGRFSVPFEQVQDNNSTLPNGRGDAAARGSATTTVTGFVFSTAAADDEEPGARSQPVTPADYLDTPSTFVLSPPPTHPQPATPTRRNRASASVSSPGVSAATAATIASVASSDPPDATYEQQKQDRSQRHGHSHDAGTTARSGSSGKRPAATDQGEAGSGSTSAVVRAGRPLGGPRLSNREAAKKCREKSKQNEQQLQQQVEENEKRNEQLKKELAVVKEEVRSLRVEVLEHGNCGEPTITNWIKARAAEISESAFSPTASNSSANQTLVGASSRLQPLNTVPINGRLNFRLQPPPPPLNPPRR